MAEDRRERIINGRLGQAKEIFDLVNTVGIGTIISVVAVGAVGAWLFGWTPTPWVTPKDFHDFNTKYMQIHDAQNSIHLEQLTEAKRQTKVLMLQRCDTMDTMAAQRDCYREAKEQQ